MTRQIVLDTETTGLDPEQGHRIIEIACVEMYHRRLTDKRFHVYLNPERDIETGALAVHGLSTDFLKDKPRFSEIVDDLIDFIDGATLIMHNASFDLGFLNHEIRRLKRRVAKLEDSYEIIDSLAIARDLHPGQRNNLEALCKRYGIDDSARQQHGALIDAELLALTYLAMTSGQNSLFEGDPCASSRPDPNAHSQIIAPQAQILRVIKANPQECAEHEQYLTTLEKLSGQCHWSREH